MKKALFALLVLTFASSICFAAQQTSATTKQTTSKQEEIRSLTGKVDSITIGDPSKGTKSEIVVLGKKELKHTFIVTSTTVITDTDEKHPTLDKISKGDKVVVKYVKNKEGAKEAISIKSIE